MPLEELKPVFHRPKWWHGAPTSCLLVSSTLEEKLFLPTSAASYSLILNLQPPHFHEKIHFCPPPLHAGLHVHALVVMGLGMWAEHLGRTQCSPEAFLLHPAFSLG